MEDLFHTVFLCCVIFIYNLFFNFIGLYRRGARRWRKIYQFNGHSFVARRFGKVSPNKVTLDIQASIFQVLERRV